ncbi:tannase/feruloyl esterase family alpha/beta hydrolase [Humitalea sp. 24SJ18S-53]|uniref:tannase/feruloyl esterase family alpha/beta hydrolase n=1 Tax=Humitalea sp. 24SJ18S-53 TaxID=3422307 RepID=UPI003D66511C
MRRTLMGLALCAALAPQAQAQPAPDTCGRLATLRIDPAAITLPTTGAQVLSAAPVTDANGTYCRVMGAILPVDPAAPRILFQANLPAQWNGRALQFGGGGYNGRIPNTTGLETHGLEGTPTPLARGFLTFGGDSGHQAARNDDASFAVNEEALHNFGYQHIRKTLDAVRQVATAHYGQAPRRVYFNGGSTGGREGMTAAIRWPDAYDGIITWYPVTSYTGLRLWGATLARAVYDDNSAGWIPPAMVTRLARDSIARCDALDGVADGLVSHPDGCRLGAAAYVESLRCPAGQTGNPDNCLTAPQIDRALRVYHEGYTLPYAFANGSRDYRGYNSLEGITMQLGTERDLQDTPDVDRNARHAALAYQFFRYFVFGGNHVDMRQLDVTAPGPVRDRILEISGLFDASATDLSRFAARGGKIIWLHGHDDASVSPLENRRNFEAIVARMGSAATDGFLRYFAIPGLAHGGGRFAPQWESLAALDAWRENGTPPDAAIITDGTSSTTRGRTRPLCRLPTWPQYRSGDPNQAASFACVAE